MALADRKQLMVRKPAFERWLESLSEQNRATVVGWLEDASIPHQRIADWVREDDEEDGFVGYRADKSTVSAWRRAHGVV